MLRQDDRSSIGVDEGPRERPDLPHATENTFPSIGREMGADPSHQKLMNRRSLNT
jgi:hypothetical protein